MALQTSNDILSESAQQTSSQRVMHTPRKGLYQSCIQNCEFEILYFLAFFFQKASPLKEHSRFVPQSSCILMGRVSTKVVKIIVNFEI